MRHIKENIFLEVKDIKTFTLIESTSCGEENSDARPAKEYPDQLESSLFVDIL